MNQFKISACDRSAQTGHTTHIILHHPTDRTASVFHFDTVQQAQAFQQNWHLYSYCIACVWFFGTHPAEMENES